VRGSGRTGRLRAPRDLGPAACGWLANVPDEVHFTAKICDRLRARGVTQLDAWTRDDEGTLAWYRSQGFEQRMRYLHVYASDPDEARAAFGSRTDLMPQFGFFHAWTDREDALRKEFSRVYSCRQFVKSLKD